MEQNKNNRLDELFKQARNETPKISAKETYKQFLKSSKGLTASSFTIKQLLILKNIIIMTISVATIAVTSVLLINNFNTAKKQATEEKILQEEELLTDSMLAIKEHEKVVKEYFESIEPHRVDLLSNQSNEHALSKINDYHLDTLKKVIDNKNGGLEIDTSYRFPNLTAIEIDETQKQKEKMFGKKRKKYTEGQWFQSDPNGFAFIPTGSITYNNINILVQAFYMQKTEVSNLEYRTFLFDLLLQDRKEEFLIAKPDQEMWVKEYPHSFNKPMVDNYFSHPAYNDYPAVGMSRKGAEMYCEWFTTELNKNNPNMLNKIRIPTDVEWMYAASGGDKQYPYPWGGPYLRNSKGAFLANFYPMKNNYKADGAFHTAKIDSYNPNDFGLYCMSGNVAEMVYNFNDSLPATKGGSWTSIGQELQIKEGKDRFKGVITPSVNIGFRPVITYLENSNNTEITVVPPGTVKIDDNLYFDKTEVSNFMWHEYLVWQAKKYGKSSIEYKTSLPDTSVWIDNLSYNQPYMEYYFSHPAYNNYPVVGITYEQAVAFCKWRSDRVKELFEIQQLKDKKGVYPTRFKYRLPTKQEWEQVANANYSAKTIKKLEGKYANKPRSNLKRGKEDNMGVAGDLKANADVTAPVQSYWPNKYDVYNIIGNVSEMTNKKGLSKGGSWMHTEKESKPENDIVYTKQSSWLGFRCVFEVLDK